MSALELLSTANAADITHEDLVKAVVELSGEVESLKAGLLGKVTPIDPDLMLKASDRPSSDLIGR